jgi:tRNA threonylcarbamoyladenosine biosynthesis protein TsaB
LGFVRRSRHQSRKVSAGNYGSIFYKGLVPTLALDTSTSDGSVALRRDDALVFARAGDGSRPHGVRLPGEALAALAAADLTLRDLSLLAVGLGPGPFTGLRVGLATIEGLAFATGLPVVGVSGLEALAVAASRAEPSARRVAAFLDAARGEVFAAQYLVTRETPLEPRAIDEPCAARPHTVLDAWRAESALPDVFIGSGAMLYRGDIVAAAPMARLVEAPLLAPFIAELGEQMAARGLVVPLHSLRPVYVRRPDAELARRRAETPRAG